MEHTRDLMTLGVLFMSLYFEIFMLITYLERRRSLHDRADARLPKLTTGDADLPGVTVIVPCFNEERTAASTIESLLALDYPAAKLKICVVNDGSTDGTAAVLDAFAADPRTAGRLSVIHKENGGKHTALNLGIARATTPLVGCLDADSYAAPDSLARIVRRFEDPSVMAVVPSLHVHRPGTLIQKMQRVEYLLGSFLRSILSELGALYVTPGPLSIIRRNVFGTIGLYRKAHNTEDMELAFRMQANGMKIVNAHDAVVYTSSPKTVKKLYKQRVRWTSGFLFNVRDYRHMIGRAQFGHLGRFILPVMLVSTASVIFVAATALSDLVVSVHSWYVRWDALGLSRMFEWSWPSFNWFFMHTSPFLFGGLAAIAAIISFIYLGSRLSNVARARPFEIACYAVLYPLIVPWWILRSILNLALSTQAAWR